ncbi:hypothetical protein Hden_1749 [Hyphomicrobium denitrificans ATCC 51888]|uniref:Outer membrane protein beta-barrel domain-containing protein n=1 Tax=Hyphomicrobium denitrificans (strain ATCC 51888 / DSM 1869 / NCIMB 11706 / TK 0415) TaxID=582899 RepID=D8JYV0_HYPDA|nr:outer membrane beta-barrel protein [Hyphomicrobium denitrificans]ADJ23552.1 hypothetical protein Hden_1749 [Hyphomicrobium denitrificans ATCC 51888]
MKSAAIVLGAILIVSGAENGKADDWSAISIGAYTQLGHFNSSVESATFNDWSVDQVRSTDSSSTNWNGGLTVAANWRLQNAVIGVAVDYDPFGSTQGLGCLYYWSDGGQSNVFVSDVQSGRCTRDVAWSASFVGKIGWLVSPTTWVYGLGGWTVSRVEQNFEKSFNLEQVHATLDGATFGGGIEYRLTENWHVNVELRYTKLNTVEKKTFSEEIDAPQFTKFGGDLETVRLGLSYVLPIR